MKKLIFTFCILFASLSAFCQSKLKSADSTYCDIMVTSPYIYMFNRHISVSVDFGLDEVKPAEAKAFDSFERPMQVLTYMAEKGWKLVGVYGAIDTKTKKETVVHYIMEKK